MLLKDISNPDFRRTMDKVMGPQRWGDVRGVDIVLADEVASSASVTVDYFGAPARKVQVTRATLLKLCDSLVGEGRPEVTQAGVHDARQALLNARNLQLMELANAEERAKVACAAARERNRVDSFEADLKALFSRYNLCLCEDGAGLLVGRFNDGDEDYFTKLRLADNLIEL